MEFFQFVFSLKRSYKRIISVSLDTIFIVFSFWLALIIRADSFDIIANFNYWVLLAFLCPVSILVFIKIGLYRAVLRYLSGQAFTAILSGILVSAVLLVFIAYFLNIGLPRTLPFIYGSFSLVLVGGSRVLMRSLIGHDINKRGEPVIIYGAGVSGRQTALALAQSCEYHPIAFVDDDPNLHNTVIQGLGVYQPTMLKKLINHEQATRILLAMPSAARSRRQQILHALEPLSVKVMTLPAMADLVSGDKLFSDVKEVEIEDLLGRDSVAPRSDLMSANISDKIVMVTGAGGSIGSELCRQIILLNPRKLVLFELSEYALYAIERELTYKIKELNLSVKVIPLLGSVQRENRLQTIMESFSVNTVYHAAAYKHVPLVEHNVVEGVRNNVFGTLATARAAINAGVETFVLISTDKAVRPTNVMGTTKRMAELVLQALSDIQSVTRFSMVRFGNVLGSSGSVVPLFRKQIALGGPVTVTHAEITRFFMTIPEASQLVIQAGAMGKGGDVFVLDMGQSVKIVDLARKMIRLSGFDVKDEHNLDGDIEIQFTGLRPGEKLYEELLIGDDVQGTEHERIMTASEIHLPWDELSQLLDNLDKACHAFDHERIRELLLIAPTGFTPTDGICDLVWQEKQNTQNEIAKKVIDISEFV